MESQDHYHMLELPQPSSEGKNVSQIKIEEMYAYADQLTKTCFGKIENRWNYYEHHQGSTYRDNSNLEYHTLTEGAQQVMYYLVNGLGGRFYLETLAEENSFNLDEAVREIESRIALEREGEKIILPVSYFKDLLS